MSKRKWADHPAVGLTMGVAFSDGEVHQCRIVDAKCGPMLFDGNLQAAEANIKGTIILRVKTPGGTEQWLPPTDGEKLCKWAEERKEERSRG